MCAGLWHRQASVLPTHFIHPCWQPVYHSHSAAGPHLPNTSPKQRLLLETWYYNHCHATSDPTMLVEYIHKHTTVASHFSTTVNSLFLVTFIILFTILRSHGEIQTVHQPDSQYALSNSLFRPHCSGLKCHLTALSIYCRFFFPFRSLIRFCCYFYWNQHKGWHTCKPK